MQSSGFKTFMGDMTADVTPIMQDFATWTENAGATFGKFLELFGGAPAQAVGSWFDRTSARLLAAFGHPAVKGHLEGGKMVGAEGATGFFRDVNVQAMDRTFDAMGKLFGTTAQAVGKLLIAAEPVAGMVAGLVLDFDHLVLALPKWFLTDFMKVAGTFMLIKTLLPGLVSNLTLMNLGLLGLSAAIMTILPLVENMIPAVKTAHIAEDKERAQLTKGAELAYKTGNVMGMQQMSADALLQAKTYAVGSQQRSLLVAEGEYFNWAAEQMQAGKAIPGFAKYSSQATILNPFARDLSMTGGAAGAGNISGAGGDVVVHVYVGGKEITDLVDTRIEHNNKKVATRVRSGKR